MATGLRRIDNESRTVRTLDYRYPYHLYEYDASGNMVYMGTHYIHGVATSDENWRVYKYTYSEDGIARIEKLEGAWDSRAALGWV